MFSDLKKKNYYLFSLILLLIIAIMLVYNFLYLQEIEKNRNIKVVNEVTEIREVEKKIAIPCIKCNSEKGNSHIQEINGVKHHHYIVPDSEFDNNIGTLKTTTTDLFRNGGVPTLMHKFIKKLNPNYEGWIGLFPSFNENINKYNENVNCLRIMTEIKYPPMDLVGIYFDKGTRFGGNDTSKDWDKYTFDEVVKETNGAENVYYFWRTHNMFEKFFEAIKTRKGEKINQINPQLNKPRCPSFAKVLTQEDINKL
jgi:hypothetical protein